MHALRALLLALIPVVSPAGEATFVSVDPSDTGALQRALLDLAEQRLQATGLMIDREHAWLQLAGKVPTGDLLALPTWSSVDGVPSLPLTFELHPSASAEAVESVRATLAVRLLQPVLVAQRRISKGSRLSCSDFELSWREVGAGRHAVPATACNVEAPDMATGDALRPGDSVLRDLAMGDVLRPGDTGRALDVMNGVPVQLRASNGGIVVTTTAIALADAHAGDEVAVRLQHPARTLHARVIGRGAVQLSDDAP